MAVGMYATRIGRNSIAWFIASFFLSPILCLLWLWCLHGDKPKEPIEIVLKKEQKDNS